VIIYHFGSVFLLNELHVIKSLLTDPVFRCEHSASIKDFVRWSVGPSVGLTHIADVKIALPRESSCLVWVTPVFHFGLF
jgi:hypothetical protein